VFKIYDDGYIVRGMTSADAKIVQEWYSGMGAISAYELDVALASFPAGRGFYIGEYQGVVVSSCVRIPWGNNAYYGSYYYVHKDYRGKGFGVRLRDEVAYDHVKEAGGKLAIDAVMGTVAKKNAAKFHYVEAWVTARYCCEAKDFGVAYNGKIVPVSAINHINRYIECWDKIQI
jgi:GNAT superfamily N-acetyltransferase